MMTDRRFKPADGLRYLARHDLLGHLSPGEHDNLLATATVQRFTTGEVLFRQGEPGSRLYVVLAGRIMISTLLENGKVNVLDILRAGEIFGAIGALDGRQRDADATVLAKSHLAVIERNDLLAFVGNNRPVAVRLIAGLCERVRRVTEPESYQVTRIEPIVARLASKLLLLAEVHGKPAGDGGRIETRISQEDLAKMTGASRESVNKQLRRWQQQGLIALGKGRGTLLDQRRLKLNTGH